MVRNGDADIVGIEGPFLGACQADLVGPVPGGTSEVGRLSIVSRREDTLSFNKVISLEASQAVSSGSVEAAALRGN